MKNHQAIAKYGHRQATPKHDGNRHEKSSPMFAYGVPDLWHCPPGRGAAASFADRRSRITTRWLPTNVVYGLFRFRQRKAIQVIFEVI